MTMTAFLTIIWPKIVAPEIDEIRFSYDFCRNLSRQLCQEGGSGWTWIECPTDTPVGDILPQVDGDMAILITHPEIVLSASAVRTLARCMEKGYRACGPVYNQTAFPLQTAALPSPYVDIETYLEVTELLLQKNADRAVPVDLLDPACILCRMGLLREIPEQTLFSDLPAVISDMGGGAMAVSPGALVHCGFLKGFETERVDLVGLVPEGVGRILDIGCAMGGYGKALKQRRPAIYLVGIELNPILAESALPYYDEVINCPIEEAGIRGVFDLINCGDILEHLQDPWRILNDLNRLLKEDGHLVLSIPNAGHWSIVRALLRGSFQYVPLGLACIGHLRWFTESSIRSALRRAGFSTDIFQREQLPPTPEGELFIRNMCSAVDDANERSLRTHGFTIRAVKQRPATSEEAHASIGWIPGSRHP